MSDNAKMNCVLLCGGKGTRMQSETKHKVCFEIDGTPSILHTIGNFKKVGVDRFITVVGALSGQVTACVGNEFPETAFVYQKDQKGTGNAAKTGFAFIEKFGIEGPLIITMGDKIITPGFIKTAMEKFLNSGVDLLVCVQPQAVNPTGGRIVLDQKGKPLCNREELDTKRAMIYDEMYRLILEGLSKDDLFNRTEMYAESILSNGKKRERVLAELRTLVFDNTEDFKKTVKEKSVIKIGHIELKPAEVDQSAYTNASFYVLSAAAARYAFPLIGDNNAQGEEYLTDIIEILALHGGFRLEMEAVRDEYDILSFNNVEELLFIEDYFRQKKAGATDLPAASCYKPVQEWIALFEHPTRPLINYLAEIYGKDDDLIEERKKAYLSVLHLFAEKHGADRKVVLSRAPGRINLMGRHIDHRGGNVNVMSINKEVIIAAGGRPDDKVTMTNTQPDFGERDFSISEHLIELDWDSWLGYLESGEAEQLIKSAKGDWVNYVKAPVLRLQFQFKDRRLRGMDMAFTGNIPMAAGLSSSSAVVVATAEAFCELNALNLSPQSFVELCGEGEWYVGSRGGAADHAAMKFAQRGQVVKLGFLPFRFDSMFQFPEGYKLIIANSHVKANKTTNAKDAFNSRVASFEFGLMMFKDKFPQYRGAVEHLRDINTDNLGVSAGGLYRMLLSLPEKVRTEELFSMISAENHTRIRSILASHKPPEHYFVRAVVLYGIAECVRAGLCKNLFEAGKIAEFGRLMNISHNGDRVVYYDNAGTPNDYDSNMTDNKLLSLTQDIASNDPQRSVSAGLANQPGGYACSTPEIDFLVDTALKVDGVMGAQISGAGLGGCVMILVREDCTENLAAVLDDAYYTPRGLQSGLTVCAPVSGSGVLNID